MTPSESGLLIPSCSSPAFTYAPSAQAYHDLAVVEPALAPGVMLHLPLRLEPPDGRRQERCPLAEQPAQGELKVTVREAVQVEPGSPDGRHCARIRPVPHRLRLFTVGEHSKLRRHVAAAWALYAILSIVSPPPLAQTLSARVIVQPNGDPGVFNVEIDRNVVARGLGNGGAFGPQSVSAGFHVITQAGASGTDLAQYVTSLTGDCAPDGSLELGAGANESCTITNTRNGQAIVPTDVMNGVTAGKTDGSGKVDDAGSATYDIPMWVPPGRAGIQPELHLVYSSSRGDGLLGVGWSLTGLFEITRCPWTYLQDGEAKAITFTDGDQGDRFCLNGERLIATGGANGKVSSYGGDGTEYRTERDMHARIVSYAPDGFGPTYFRIYLKDGRILTLGGSQDSRLEGERAAISVTASPPVFAATYAQHVRYAWNISQLRDRAGNYLTVTYRTTVVDHGYELVPTDVDYTAFVGDPSVLPLRHVSFTYKARPDPCERYVAGLRLLRNHRLTQVTMWWGKSQANAVVPRVYQLAYIQGGMSNRTLLSSVQECHDSNVTRSPPTLTCKAPTSFQWSIGDAGFDDLDTAISATGPVLTGDVDGDGRDDLIVMGPKLGSTLTFYPSTGNAFVPPPGVATGLQGGARLIDISARGAVALALQLPPYYFEFPPNIPFFKQQFFVWLGAGFVLLVDLDGELYNQFPRPDYWLDLNGDGLPDSVRPGPATDLIFPISGPSGLGGSTWTYRVNTGGQLGRFADSGIFANFPVGTYDSPQYRTLVFGIDLNGSGRASLLSTQSQTAFELSGGHLQAAPTTFLGEMYGFCDPVFADVNGDGLLDWISTDPKGGVLNVSINTGNGFAQPIQWAAPAPYDSSPSLKCDVSKDTGIRPFRYSDRGRDDLLLMGGYTPAPGAPNQLAILEWTGTSFVPVPLSIAASTPPPGPPNPGYVGVWGPDWHQSQLLDMNGDGLPDFIQPQSTTQTIHVYTRRGMQPDLLTDVVDGFGATEHFEYSALISRSVYQPGDNCSYPQSCVKRGMWVASTHQVSSPGSGVTRRLDYSYRDGRSDIAGRGWIGFGQVTETEAARRTSTTTYYDNTTRVGTAYPCARMPTETSTRVEVAGGPDPAQSIVHESRTATECKVVSEVEGKVYFSYARRSDRTEWEGPEQAPLVLLSKTTGLTEQDEFGNVTSHVTDVYDVDSGTNNGRSERMRVSYAWENFEGSWLIGQLMGTRQVNEDRTGRSSSVELAYEYAPDTGLLRKAMREPASRDVPARGGSDFYLETDITRNAFGLPTQITTKGSGQAGTVDVTYDAVEAIFPASVTNALRQTWSYSYEPSRGLLITLTDPNGLLTRYRYDGFGRVRLVKPPDSAHREFHYVVDPSKRPKTSVNDGAGTLSQMLYDAQRRELASRWLGFGGAWASAEITYDSLGRIATRSLPHFNSDSPVIRSFTYDNLDRLLRSRNADGSVDIRKYEGLKTDIQSANQNKSYTVQDGSGRVVLSAVVDLSSREVKTAFHYAPAGSIDRITDAYGNVISLDYDRLGRRTLLSDSDVGAIRTHYDAFGNVRDQTDGAGRQTRYTWDPLGRPVTITSPDGVTTFVWDTSANGIGKLASSLSPNGIAVGYAYDASSRLRQQTWTVSGSQYPFLYAYDGAGRVSTITYPPIAAKPPLVIQRNYTLEGELQSITDGATGALYWSASGRNAAERLTSETFGNGVTTTRSYGPEGLLQSITSVAGSTPLQCIEYGQDSSGNVTSRDMTHNSACSTSQGPNIQAVVESAPVDWVDRIATWGGVNSVWSIGFAFDDIGNIKQQTGSVVPQPPQMSYTYAGPGVHAVTQVTSGATTWKYQYDGAGNQITGPRRRITYTSLNLPSRMIGGAHDIKFAYDAFGHRVLKRDVRTGRSTLYVNGLFERRNGSHGSSASYVLYLPTDDRIVGQIVSTGTRGGAPGQAFYFHDDLLGSIETVSDGSGNSVERFSYNPFGVKRRQVPPSGQPEVRLGFNGAEEDVEFGLLNLVGRMYDPILGRFLSADPFVANPFSGQSYNRYSYVLNDPLTLRDPTGLQAEESDDSSTLARGPQNQTVEFGPSIIVGRPSPSFAPPPTVSDNSSGQSAAFPPTVIVGTPLSASPPPPPPPANTADDQGSHVAGMSPPPSAVCFFCGPPVRSTLSPLGKPRTWEELPPIVRRGLVLEVRAKLDLKRREVLGRGFTELSRKVDPSILWPSPADVIAEGAGPLLEEGHVIVGVGAAAIGTANDLQDKLDAASLIDEVAKISSDARSLARADAEAIAQATFEQAERDRASKAAWRAATDLFHRFGLYFPWESALGPGPGTPVRPPAGGAAAP